MVLRKAITTARSMKMTVIFCFILGAGHRLETATVSSRWSEADGCVLFSLHAKWRGYSGGYTVPLASIQEGLGYIKRDAA